jgi:hypothetical protein
MTIAKDIFMVAQVQRQALERMEMGGKTYGEFNPKTDERCLYDEMIDELMDFMNYASMQIIKLRHKKANASVHNDPNHGNP